LLLAKREKRGVETAIEMAGVPTGMKVAEPEMMETEEEVPVILEGEAIPGKEEESREEEVPDSMDAVLEKILEGVEEGEESRASTWCFRNNPREYHRGTSRVFGFGF
tara:strand:- start:672 stop:992 length:321 start_codon:yes stop_codon:yes gene_type:complete